MTRRRIPCTLSSRVIGSSPHSGSLGRVSTLGKIGPMAFLFVHGKCQHYYESGQSSRRLSGEDSADDATMTPLRQALLRNATHAARTLGVQREIVASVLRRCASSRRGPSIRGFDF